MTASTTRPAGHAGRAHAPARRLAARDDARLAGARGGDRLPRRVRLPVPVLPQRSTRRRAPASAGDWDALRRAPPRQAQLARRRGRHRRRAHRGSGPAVAARRPRRGGHAGQARHERQPPGRARGTCSPRASSAYVALDVKTTPRALRQADRPAGPGRGRGAHSVDLLVGSGCGARVPHDRLPRRRRRSTSCRTSRAGLVGGDCYALQQFRPARHARPAARRRRPVPPRRAHDRGAARCATFLPTIVRGAA